MSATTPTRPLVRRIIARVVTPAAVSLLVHAAAIASIAAVAFYATSRHPRTEPALPVVIDAPAPASQPTPPATSHPSLALPGPVAAPAPSTPSQPLPGLFTDPAGDLPRPADQPTSLDALQPVGIGLTTDLPATFAGLRARRAASVVFVVDASGAMVTSLPFVIDELVRSIDRLSPRQRFQVILFRDRPPPTDPDHAGVECFADGRLRHAGQRNTRAVQDWLRRVEPIGRSNPLDGLRAALQLRPEVIFLLTRSIPRSGSADTAASGDWERGARAVLDELDRLNPIDPRTGRRPVVIKTIQFLEADPTGLMQAIAQEHGDGEGSYRVLTLDELSRR